MDFSRFEDYYAGNIIYYLVKFQFSNISEILIAHGFRKFSAT